MDNSDISIKIMKKHWGNAQKGPGRCLGTKLQPTKDLMESIQWKERKTNNYPSIVRALYLTRV